MKLKLSQLLFASLIFASFSVTAQESIRCGWVVNQNDSNIELVDSQGTYLLAVTPGTGPHIDLTRGLVHMPKVHIQANSVKVFCGCARLELTSDSRFIHPLGGVKQFTEKSLDTCFKDPMLPHLERIVR